MDITPLPPFARVSCPSCGEKSRVKTEFGPYHLDRRLSTGGMSVLFVARDTLLDREVAVKILNEEYSADERRITAFEEEARVTASLSHPNIVRVLTTGRAFGRFFIAMELVPGGHFEHHIRTEGKIPEARMLKLAIQIANGLKAAHEAKLIHRDIKPGNILLDADGNAKIVDFGLALVTQGGTARAKEFWATPYYVPPETIEGASEDFRADIYAFGATLYHALAGKPPCNEESMSINLLRNAKKNIVPLRVAQPELSMAVCEIVDKAMAYHPHERYASYDQLLNDLQDAANRTKHGLKRESAGQVANRRSRARRARHMALASVGLIGGIALISALAWLINHGTEHPPPSVTIPPINGQTQKPPPATNAIDLGKLYADARESFSRQSFGAAVDRFSRLYNLPEVHEPTRTWAGVQAIVAALLDEDGTRARLLSNELREHLSIVDPGDPEIRAILMPLFDRIAAEQPVVFTADDPPLTGASALFAWLLAGIHEWQFGDHVRAASYFKIALEVNIDDASWLAIHQDVARNHLADLALLDDPACHTEPANMEEAEEILEELMSIRSSVRTRGPIPGMLQEHVSRINQIRRAFVREAELAAELAAEQEAGREVENWEREPKPPLTNPFESQAPDDSPPEEMPITRDQVMKILADYEFEKARKAMLRLGNDEIELNSRTTWMQVVRNAESFMEALARDVADDAIPITALTLKSGEIITGIRSHAKQTPADQDGNPIPWNQIHPDSYIDWHRARILRVDESERIEAHNEAIAFDLLVGDRFRALTAIQRLSETNANFESYWKLVLERYPK